VFWNGEFVHTLRLKQEGVLAEYQSPQAADLPDFMRDKDNRWTAFGGRYRVFIANKDFKPRSLALTDLPTVNLPGEKLAESSPLFGTSSAQAAALYAYLGPQKARAAYEALVKKGVRIAAGNSVVRDLVVSGDVTLGIVDSDDANDALREGAKVQVFLPKETVLIPQTTAIISGAPHRKEAEALVDFLLSAEVEKMLVEAGYCQAPFKDKSLKPSLLLPEAKLVPVRPDDVVRLLAKSSDDLRPLFVK
jgi:iron(III) transport system substrate-binding protein